MSVPVTIGCPVAVIARPRGSKPRSTTPPWKVERAEQAVQPGEGDVPRRCGRPVVGQGARRLHDQRASGNLSNVSGSRVPAGSSVSVSPTPTPSRPITTSPRASSSDLRLSRNRPRELADGGAGSGCERGTMVTEIALELPREPVAPTIARRTLRDALDGLLGAQALCDLSVVVSELVTNAVVHGEGAIHLHVELRGGELKGEVSDEGRGFELPLDVDQLHIRGLFFVQRYTTRWGVQEGTGRVWFEMPAGEH